MKKIFLLIIIVSFLFSGCVTDVAVFPYDVVDVSIQDYTGEGFSFFLTKTLSEPILLNNISIGDLYITVDSVVNCTNFKAINIYDNESYFQGLILSASGNIINLSSEVDRNFSTTNTYIECAEWDLSTVDGTNNEEIFKIRPPTNKSWHITTTIIKITDNLDWDLSKFGGGAPLTNGISGRITDGYEKDLFLIYDNSGFALRGFDVQDFAKAPAGVYGFSALLDFKKIYGNVIELNGQTNDEWQAVARDPLISQTEIAITVNGHYTTD